MENNKGQKLYTTRFILVFGLTIISLFSFSDYAKYGNCDEPFSFISMSSSNFFGCGIRTFVPALMVFVISLILFNFFSKSKVQILIITIILLLVVLLPFVPNFAYHMELQEATINKAEKNLKTATSIVDCEHLSDLWGGLWWGNKITLGSAKRERLWKECIQTFLKTEKDYQLCTELHPYWAETDDSMNFVSEDCRTEWDHKQNGSKI